jgi:hypothetical protein
MINVFSEDDFATIAFTSLVSAVCLDYVSLDPIVLTAYDSANHILDSAQGSANTDGTTGSNSLLSVSSPDIAYVTLGNTGLADEYAFDNLTFAPQQQSAVPEPGSGLLLLSGIGILVALRPRWCATHILLRRTSRLW